MFYPDDLAQHRELEFASRQLNSIEINGTFYSLQRPTSFEKWYEATPDDFVFSVKATRFITHILRLKEVETPLANFFASGLLKLKEKLGPILWQLPPNFHFDEPRLEAFFKQLPHDTSMMAKLAKKHDKRLKHGTCTKADKNRAVRHAIEVRHDSFKTPQFIRLCRKYEVAIVIADTAGKWPFFDDLTADFVYARLHGDKQLYVSGYTKSALDAWAKRFKRWKRTREIYAYFDNDVKVKAPFDAMALAERLGGGAATTVSPKKLLAAAKRAKPRRSWPGERPRKRT